VIVRPAQTRLASRCPQSCRIEPVVEYRILSTSKEITRADGSGALAATHSYPDLPGSCSGMLTAMAWFPPSRWKFGVIAVVVCLTVAGCGGSATIIKASKLSDQAVCTTIDGYFYYPTVPTGGVTVSLTTAKRVESLLRNANAAELRAQAAPLQRAIDSDDATKLVTIFEMLSQNICSTLGIPPPT
jgi:hypothetical protein